ncbi:MAG: hypothetical protein AAB554_03440 [Patescibacteria group bacterium]
MSEQKPVFKRAILEPVLLIVIGLTVAYIAVAIITPMCIAREPEPDVKVGQYGIVRMNGLWEKPFAEPVTVKVVNPDPIMGYAEGDQCILPDDGSVKIVAISAERWDVLMEYRGTAGRTVQPFPGMCPAGTLFRVLATKAEEMCKTNLRIHDYRRGRERALVEAYYLSTHLP